MIQWIHTLNSEPVAAVWARTTRCANFMQQILTVGPAFSHILKTFCLTATILSHVIVSYPLFMLHNRVSLETI